MTNTPSARARALQAHSCQTLAALMTAPIADLATEVSPRLQVIDGTLARLLREGSDAELEAFTSDAATMFGAFALARGPKAVEAARALYPEAVARADAEYRAARKAEADPARADAALEAFADTAASLVGQTRRAVLAKEADDAEIDRQIAEQRHAAKAEAQTEAPRAEQPSRPRPPGTEDR
jgi:hypothetical protein